PDPAETQIFKNEQAGRDFQRLQTHRAERNERSAEPEAICQTQRAIAADRIQSEANWRAACRSFYFIAQLFAVNQNGVAAFCAQFVDQLRAPDHVYRFESELARNLNHCAARRRI